MARMESSSMGVALTTLKCRMKRPVMWLRPPPGGPMAAMATMSITLRNTRSLRSYHPL